MGENISGPRSRGSELPIILSEGIRRSKGGVVNITKRTVPFTELYPEEMSLSGGEYTIAWLRKWNHCDQEYKSMLC